MSRGFGTLVGVKKVQVTPFEGEPVQLDARLAVALCTGSTPIYPDIPGLREADPWTPRDATSSSHVPEHLIIMGGGVVGSEMATAYSSFGAKVTVVSSSSEILSSVDPEVRKIVRESLEAKGVSFHLSARVVNVQPPAEGKVTVELSTGDSLSGTELLVATGRTANLEGIGLEQVGLRAEGRSLPVDENLCVTDVEGKWLYAPGDPLETSPPRRLAFVAIHFTAYSASENTVLQSTSGMRPYSNDTMMISLLRAMIARQPRSSALASPEHQ